MTNDSTEAKAKRQPMMCPRCGGFTSVIWTRPKGTIIKRLRECDDCKKRFRTEQPKESLTKSYTDVTSADLHSGTEPPKR